jgi:hypothetical protein
MRILIFYFIINCYGVIGQDFVTGTIIDLETKKPISTESESYKCFLSGGGNLISVAINGKGEFHITKSELTEIGKTITFFIGTLGTNSHYADFELLNIPIDSIEMALKQVFVTREFMIPSCGPDCFTVTTKEPIRRR